VLHVTNGDSAAQGIAAAGLGGEVLSWRDTLHEGPLPADLGPAVLRARRVAFLAACGWGDAGALEADLRARDERLAGALGREPVVLWFEHDLYDQLQLVQVLSGLPEDAPVKAILADRYLGAMAPEELAALWPGRAPVSAAQRAEARRAWAAVRDPDPAAVEALLARPPSALPHLAAALARWLEELPAAGDGLARSERQALLAIAGGAATPRDAFPAAQAAEEAVFLGDDWFHRRLADVGRGERRLVETADGAPLGEPPPAGDGAFTTARVRLTERGRAVLAGAADRAAGPPLDRWLGGARLTGPRPVRRWDRAAGRVV
jgi:Domain of unknown function (DUF1835)